MKTVTIDILSNEALHQLKNLENQNLIRMHNQELNNLTVNWKQKYKGAMTQQSLSDVEKQLNELRSEWE